MYLVPQSHGKALETTQRVTCSGGSLWFLLGPEGLQKDRSHFP